MQANVSSEVLGDNHAETSLVHKLTDKSPSSHVQNSTSISDGPESGGRRPTVWGRTPGKKLAMESVDLPFEDEAEIERLEVTKIDLLDRIAEEASGNENLQASLERRKNASHERRLALEQEVLAEEGKAKAVAFDEIDKAPEEKKRGITIAMVKIQLCLPYFQHYMSKSIMLRPMWSTKLLSSTMLMSTAQDMQTMLKALQGHTLRLLSLPDFLDASIGKILKHVSLNQNGKVFRGNCPGKGKMTRRVNSFFCCITGVVMEN